MGFFSDIVSSVTNVVSSVADTVGSAVQSTVNAVTNHPLEVAALAAGGYAAGVGALGASADGLTAAVASPVAAGSVAETALPALGTNAANDALVSGLDLGGVGGSPATWGANTYASNLGSGITAKDVLTTANTGLNVATAAAKVSALSTLGKTGMTTSTSNGATAAALTDALSLAPSNIQTPSVVATTPQSAIVNQPAGTGMMGFSNQTLMLIAVLGGALYFMHKKG